MIVWKNLLQPITAKLHKNATMREALQAIHATISQTVFIHDDGTIIGYINSPCLLKQMVDHGDLDSGIAYDTDVLLVPQDQPVEFYHNVSIVLGIDQDGQITGFCSLQDAKNKIAHLQLLQKNQIFHSAGIGVITTDCDFRITFINEMAENIIGLSRNVLLHRNYKTLLAIKDLEEVLVGKQLVSVSNTLNIKQLIGNFSPLYEDGKITGIVHIFYLREQLEEAIQELEMVRNLNEDLQAIYSLSDEEIIVINAKGEIVRVAGTFFKDFWALEDPGQLIGKRIHDLQKAGLFQENIVEKCRNSTGKVVYIHENAKGRKVWSVATPVYHDDKLEKVVVISRDITEFNQLKQELEIVKKKSDQYKQELDEIMKKTQQEKKLIYRSKVMEDLVNQIKQIAAVDSTVLLYGESGVGKEVFAQTIHQYSQRSTQPFIRVNCGAIPENLMESEFFGYEKGAFTGADRNGKPGLFELANKGSIFLDEITELPLNLQVKLLRVLQEREVMRIGGVKSIKIDVRVIAATNRDTQKLVEEKKFRQDLFYRLNVIPIDIPPLRERVEDIISLSINFLQQYNQSYHREKNVTREALDVLESYHWPGNVRELQNVIERLVVTTTADSIEAEDVMSVLYGKIKDKKMKPVIGSIVPLKEAVEEVESQLIKAALQKYGTAEKAAKVLGISKATISRRIHRLLK